MKRFKKFFLLWFIFGRMLALELNITNEISDIAATKKINVNFEFDEQTHAVLCSSINFSVDNPNIIITSADCTQRPNVQFLQNFKREKKVFTQPFLYELKIDTKLNNHLLTFEELKKSNLYASCIVIEKNGHVSAISLSKPFCDDILPYIASQNLTMNTFTQTDVLNTLTGLFIKDRFKNHSNYTKFEKEPENLIIEKLKGLSAILVKRINDFANKINFFFFYLTIIILMLSLFILVTQHAFIKKWMSGTLKILIFASFIMTFLLLKSQFVLYKFYVGLAALFFMTSFYYIFSAKTNSVKDKLKSLLGFVLTAAAIPILVKAFLVFKGLS